MKIHKNRIDWQDRLTDCHDSLFNYNSELIAYRIRTEIDNYKTRRRRKKNEE